MASKICPDIRHFPTFILRTVTIFQKTGFFIKVFIKNADIGKCKKSKFYGV